MLLITDMLFSHGDIELQLARSNEKAILWFLFRLLLKSRPYCSVENYSPSQSPTKTLYVCPFWNWRIAFTWTWFSFKSCTPVAINSFSCPCLRSSYTATLSSKCFRIFLPSGIQSGEETDVGRHRLNRALEFLFTFTLVVFRTKQGARHERIQLMKCFHFLSTRTINSARLILGSQYSLCDN